MKATRVLFTIGFLMAIAVAVALPNEVSAMVQHIGLHDFTHTSTLGTVALVSLANLDADSEGTPNPGGTRRLFIVHAKDLAKEWPQQADIVDGEITVAPELVANAGFAEYTFPDGTFNVTDSQEGDPGFMSFKHMAGFMLAGYSKKIVAEVLKHLNAGSVIIGELNDDQYLVAGSKKNPMYIKSNFSSGGKGSDKRGYTCKGEQDGFMWGVVPLKPSLVAGLTLLPVV